MMEEQYGMEALPTDDDLIRRRDVREAFQRLTRFSNTECRDVINSVSPANE